MFNAVLFPDVAVLEDEFLKASLVYFDRVATPYFGRDIMDDDAARNAILSLPGKAGFDVTATLERQHRAVEVSRKLLVLEGMGLVNRLPPVLKENIGELTNRAVRAMRSGDPVSRVASAYDVWLEDGFHSISSERQPAFEYLRYCLGAVNRLAFAKLAGYQVATHSTDQFHALRQVQEVTLLGPPLMLRASVIQAIRVTLPRLLARDLEDIVEIRERLREFLEPFRLEMTKLVSEIPEDASARAIRRHLREINDRNIAPRVSELKRYLASEQQVFQKHLVGGSGPLVTAGITLLGYVVAGMDFMTAVPTAALSTIAATVVSAGLKTVSEVSRTKRMNPFTFAVLAENAAERLGGAR